MTFSERFLRSNVEALGLGQKTRRAVLDAHPCAEVVAADDGTLSLRVHGQIVGAPPDARALSRTFGKFEDNGAKLVVIFGLGLGHAVREVRARSSAPILVFEPEPGTLRSVLELGPSDLGGSTIVTTFEELDAVWPQLVQEGSCHLVVTPGYAELYRAELDELHEHIAVLLADTDIIENTRQARFRNWLEHLFDNLHVLERTSPFLALRARYKNVPAFIVGAGPSLDRNVELLREAGEKGLVLAVDVAGRALDRHGVEPQVLVSLEALDLSKHMADLSFLSRVVRATSLTAHPSSVDLSAGHLLPFHEGIRQFSPIAELTGAPGVLVGGSVSTVAFALAYELGCSPIVLVGQDLAYTGGATHAKDTPFDGCAVRIGDGAVEYEWNDTVKAVRAASTLGAAPKQEQLFMVPAWGEPEATVASTPSFNAFRLWFEVFGEALAGSDTALVNATEGGSSIRGFRERTLREVLDELSPRRIGPDDLAAAAREAIPPMPPATLARWARAQGRLLGVVESRATDLVRSVRAARRALVSDDPRRVSAAWRRVEEAEELLRAASAAVPLLDGWTYAEMCELDRGAPADDLDMRVSADRALEHEERLANVVSSGARELGRKLAMLSPRNRGKLAHPHNERPRHAKPRPHNPTESPESMSPC